MKKVLLLPILFLIAISCKKEIPQSPELISNAALQLTAKASYSLDYIIFNPCTGEDMHVTGTLKSILKGTIVDTVIHYNHEVIYSLKGIGMTTGNKYQGSGHLHDNYKGTAVLVHDAYLGDYYLATPQIERIVNKIQFVTPGGKNNLSQDLTYNLHTTKDGLQIENISWKFASCQ